MVILRVRKLLHHTLPVQVSLIPQPELQRSHVDELYLAKTFFQIYNVRHKYRTDIRTGHSSPYSSSQPQEMDLSLAARLRDMLVPYAFAFQPPSEATDGIQEWEIIGAGQCGSIFTQVGRRDIAKICNKDFDPVQLWNDWLQHQRIIQVMEKYHADAPSILIPQPLGYLTEDDTTKFIERHPGLKRAAETSYKVKLPAQILIAERIPLLPEEARTALVNVFCHVELRQKVLDTPTNKDCLVRVYLGAENHKALSPLFFTLRNLCLYQNHFEFLQLDVKPMAIAMARTLAIIHWAAGCDGRDIEFVLGSKRGRRRYDVDELEHLEIPTSIIPDNFGCLDHYCPSHTQLYCLDFNQVSRIKFDKTGAEAAAIAFFENDPYYLRPHQGTLALDETWDLFASAYLDMAEKILGSRDQQIRSLPLFFLITVSALVRGSQGDRR